MLAKKVEPCSHDKMRSALSTDSSNSVRPVVAPVILWIFFDWFKMQFKTIYWGYCSENKALQFT